jgi:ankyrin repeat protein
MHGKINCVHLLLRHDVHVDPVDKEERTPLFYASRLGHLDICKMLVAKRANYNARDAKRK